MLPSLDQSAQGVDRSQLGKWSACLYVVPDLPLIKQDDDLAQLIYAKSTARGFAFCDGDVVVVTQKIVSKAEGAVLRLSDIEPSAEAEELAQKTGRDARLCEVYLRESQEIISTNGRVVITRHRLGFQCTSAGVDRSNVDSSGELVALLPHDPDASARKIREGLRTLTGCDVAVIISDSFGKPDREGAIGVAIGLAGIRHLEEHEQQDLFGKESNPWINLVDELAGAAAMLMGETGEGRPVTVVRGVPYTRDESASIRGLLV